MKQIILKTIPGLLLLFVMMKPNRGRAQCLCEGGVASTPIEHVFRLDTTSSSTNNLVFPRFDPSIGTLSCVTLHDTVSIVSLLGIRNIATEDVSYRFRLTVTTSINGPAPTNVLYHDDFNDRTYGPSLLGAAGSATDSIVYGPDTIFNNVTAVNNIPNVVAFLGAGNVSLSYTIGGGVASLAGGMNFNSSVRTRTWGTFKLTYYWCPAGILAANIKSFAAVKDNNRVNLSWQVVNEEANNIYELQVSSNGRQFNTIKTFNAGNAPDGFADYKYQYLQEQAMSGKIYFRVKQTNTSGKATYSVVRFVDANQTVKPGGATVYPNPVRGQVSVQFGKTLNGDYKVELVNLTGQVVYQRIHRMNNINSILFDIPGTPAGIYYLRARNTQGNETFTSKLTVQH